MTITLVNPASWGVNEKMTTTQLNALQTNITNALDKRAGQTDTLGSVVSATGGGRIIPPVVTGPDANASLVAGVNANTLASALTAPRTYTLSPTGAIAGDTIYVRNTTSQPLTVIDGATSTTLIQLTSSLSSGESLWANFFFNGTSWSLQSSMRSPQLVGAVFLSSGTWTCPPGVYFVVLYGFGAGGGGAAGAPGVYSTSSPWPTSVGGGGGGAARPTRRVVPVTPGTTYVVTIGNGGPGGVPGNLPGSDGADTTFDTLATFRGAQGGTSNTNTSSSPILARGGATVRGATAQPTLTSSFEGGFGGYGANLYSSVPGEPSEQGFLGGAAAAAGTTDTGIPGGGPGGGGGAGPGGNGGAAGAGANGLYAGGFVNGLPGNNGTAALANTGAGGGGGGAGGPTPSVSFTSGNGGNGGAGGSGFLQVVPLR